MGTPGRKRNPVRETFAAEDEALGHIAKEAEARLAAKRTARAEAREIRLKELEKQQKEIWQIQKKYQLQHNLDDESNAVQQWVDGIDSHAKQTPKLPPKAESDVSSVSSVSSQESAGSITRSSPVYRSKSKRKSGSRHNGYNEWAFDDYESFTSSTRSSSRVLSKTPKSHTARASSSRRTSPTLDDPTDGEPLESTAKSVTRSSVSSLSSVTLGSLGSSMSKQTSAETSPGDDALIKENLRDVEEKYKVAMMSNAQLDNEKANLIYQVDTLRDTLEELEEQMAELRREHGDKCKELERQKHENSVLKFKFEEVHEALKQRDELIERHGLVLVPETDPNGGDSSAPEGHCTLALVSREAAEVLNTVGDGPLDVRLKKLAEDKENLLEEVRSLKEQLEEVKQKSSDSNMDLAENGVDILETHRDVNRQLNDYKFKLSKAEQDIMALEQSVARLETQVARYKVASENAERVEDELKADKRKLQRELRSVQDRVEELEITNGQLNKRMEKMRANRNLAAAQD
uniref:leucine-rich repeat flightless-interacting protein 2 isoform X2 n=1 Tax=Myxine glutinosa TaxID=7769 RepID=UPI00358F1A06